MFIIRDKARRNEREGGRNTRKQRGGPHMRGFFWWFFTGGR